MDLFIKAYRVAIVVILIISAGQKLLTKDLRALQISVHRFDNESDALQLHLYWGTSTDEEGDTLYLVKVHHIFSEKCTMEHTKFENQHDIACAPIVTETEDTSVLLPRDPKALDKHVCMILPYCSYEVTVKPLDYNWHLSKTFEVPECIQQVCSCYYDKHLPNVTSFTYISENKMIASWSLQGNVDYTHVPIDVKLENIVITVRRGNNENLVWGGKESSKKVVYLPAGNNGSYTFDVRDFPGDKAIFVTHVRLYDSRRCYSEAAPQRAFIRKDVVQETTKTIEVQIPTSALVKIFSLVIISTVAVGAIIYGGILVRGKRRSPRVVKNWRGGHDRPCSNQNAGSMQMEENHLYTDWDVLEARARGEADSLEVPLSSLQIGREIGKGAFGRVFIACATKLPGCSGSMIVAVKQLKKCPKQMPEFEEFLDEITMMKQVGRHPNIVTLLGCCTLKDPLTMIMEYVGCGDLLEYLRKIRAKHLARAARLDAAANQRMTDTVSLQRSISNHSSSTVFGPMLKYIDMRHTSSSNSDPSYITQPDTTLRPSLTETTYTTLSGGKKDSEREQSSIEYLLDHKELHDFARQIASGMQHLEEKQITHRDLAARNILIDERKTLKISDFGLSRTGIYVNTRNKKVPLRWLSIEAMRDNLYSSKSDVWAFGVVLWEIGTLGGYPYPTVSNHELLSYLQQENRLDRPENCSTELYELMLNCWKADPNDRPSFRDIFKSLEPHRRIYIDFNDIEPTYVFPPTSEQIEQAASNNK